MKPIYLDHSAATPVLPQVWDAMRPYFLEEAANPASSHAAGRRAHRALEDARERIAHHLDAHPDEVLFTSGATEGNNLAIFGLCSPHYEGGVRGGKPDAPGTIVTSPIEHPSVVEPVRQLTDHGFTHVELPVDPAGIVASGADVKLPTDACLIAVMLANHETGALQPVQTLGERLDLRAPFHCDAAAAAGKIAISFRRLGVTSLCISAHKFHGPKGIGALLIRKGTKIRPLFFGGHQQHGKRPGTEPVALAVGMATALDMAMAELESNRAAVANHRASFLAQLRAKAQPVIVNGPEAGGIDNILNVSFPGCQADVLHMNLDLAGVSCSTGSACSSGSLLPSPVLRAMGLADAVLKSSIRFSFSPYQSLEDVLDASSRIINSANMLRS